MSVAVVERSAPAMVDAALAAKALAERRAEGARGAKSLARARLTRREIEILRLVAEGHTNREVAKLLWLSDQTVKFHLANTYRKLGVRNRFEASEWAFARSLVRDVAEHPPGGLTSPG